MAAIKEDSLILRAIAGAISGVPAGLAHALVNEIDRRALRHDADDLLLLSGMVIEDRSTARRVGLLAHLCTAMGFGAVWAIALRPTDERNAVRKGIAAGLVENTVLWPLVIPLDNHHPYILQGRMDRFNHPISYIQACLRHVALGYVLGKTYPRVRDRLARLARTVALDVR